MSTSEAHCPDTPTLAGETRSVGEIVSDISTDMSTLIRQEMDLAKTEMKQEVAKLGKGAGMLGGARLGWLVHAVLPVLRADLPARTGCL